jgi:hypothetical protein
MQFVDYVILRDQGLFKVVSLFECLDQGFVIQVSIYFFNVRWHPLQTLSVLPDPYTALTFLLVREFTLAMLLSGFPKSFVLFTVRPF